MFYYGWAGAETRRLQASTWEYLDIFGDLASYAWTALPTSAVLIINEYLIFKSKKREIKKQNHDI